MTMFMFQNQPRTLDYEEPKEGLFDALIRHITDLYKKAPQFFQGAGKDMQKGSKQGLEWLQPQVEKAMRAGLTGLTYPMRGVSAPFDLGAYLAGLPQFGPGFTQKTQMLPDRIGQMAQMKMEPSPNQAPPQPMPPPQRPQMAYHAPAPPQAMPPPQNYDQPQEQMQPAQVLGMPESQGPMSPEEYFNMWKNLMPEKEETWMDSPAYPLALGLLGLGTHLQTPYRFRGYQSPWGPMVAAMGQQARGRRDDRGVFEKAMTSYPSYVSATQRGAPNYNFVVDAEGNVRSVLPGGITRLPEKQQNLFYDPDTRQVYPMGKGDIKLHKGSKENQDYFTVYDPATDSARIMRGKGTVIKRDQNPFMMNQNQNQGRSVVVQMDDGSYRTMTEEEAKRAGYQWRR